MKESDSASHLIIVEEEDNQELIYNQPKSVYPASLNKKRRLFSAKVQQRGTDYVRN